jgi:glycosyltransferase involved in cell wall biosynthesis
VRILHVIPSIEAASGGPTEGLRQLCRIYHGGGHEIHIASLDSPAAAARIDFPAKVFGLGPGWGVYGYSPRAVPWFVRNITNYDVVFLNGVWQYDALSAYRALSRARVPYAVFAHGMLDPYFRDRFPLKHLKKSLYWRLLLSRILHDANAVLFTCEEEKRLARESFQGYAVREMVVPFGTFPPRTDLGAASSEFLHRWPQLRGKRLALSMGRLDAKKGVDLLLRAFAETLGRDASWRLVVAGPGHAEQQARLVYLAHTLKISSSVLWTGMLEGALKWGALATAELFILPSHQENFGMVIAEAMACRLPVIVTKKVNVWRDVQRSGAGLVCDDTFEGVRESLLRWQMMKAEEITAMGMRSRRCFDGRFNYERMTEAVLEVVDQIAGRSRGPQVMSMVSTGMARRDV